MHCPTLKMIWVRREVQTEKGQKKKERVKGGRDKNERRCRGREREGEIGTREGAEERKGKGG